MKICVVTDDNAGFSKQEINELGIYVVRMPILIDEDTYFENISIDEKTFYQKMADNADIKTSQPAPGEIMELWDNLLKTYDAILHIPMSSGLSEECNTAKVLAQNYEGKVFVVDNHRISVTLKAAVRDALKLIKEGKDPEYIREYLTKDGLNSTIYIMVYTLKYLKKGGRITPAAALIGGALHLKPVLTLLGQKLDAFKKAIGTKKAKLIMIDAIKNDLATKFTDYKKEDLIFSMAYTYDFDEAIQFKKEFAEAIGIDEKQIEMNPLSLSVATHIGPGALAVTVSNHLKWN